MRVDWRGEDPCMLEPRPRHCATDAEIEDFQELLQQLGAIASHLGATMDVDVSFRMPRRAPRRPEGPKEGGE